MKFYIYLCSERGRESHVTVTTVNLTLTCPNCGMRIQPANKQEVALQGFLELLGAQLRCSNIFREDRV